jgi:hypothetical protein
VLGACGVVWCGGVGSEFDKGLGADEFVFTTTLCGILPAPRIIIIIIIRNVSGMNMHGTDMFTFCISQAQRAFLHWQRMLIGGRRCTECLSRHPS